VRPESIFLRSDGRAKVLEFGTAQLTEGVSTDCREDLRAVARVVRACVAPGASAGALDSVITRALEDGYDDAADMNGAIADATAGMETAPIVPPAPKREPAGRMRAIAVAVAAIVLITMAALGVRAGLSP
jgi:hypothetical protein